MDPFISDHPWSSLSTITTFDIGDENEALQKDTLKNSNLDDSSTELIRKINIIGLLKAKASTPISLLVESLVQQLCSLLEPDEIKAGKLYNVICEKLYEMKLIDESYSMDEFEVMRSQYQRALYQLVGVAQGSNIPSNIHLQALPPNSITLDSRYHKEFIELNYIGGGGFGRVYKVRHRLDESEYAVKKIFISAGTVKAVMTHLREVKTFAILNHPNVVQYKAAWLEPFIYNTKHCVKNESHCESYSLFSESEENIKTINKFQEKDDSSFLIEFIDSQGKNNSIDSNTLSRTASDETAFENQICQRQTLELNRSKPTSEWVTLYIQMALCQKTLKQWLEERNQLERENINKGIDVDGRMSTVRHIFKQMVAGLVYIHSKGIVHHDIKPSNIFISTEGKSISVQLGDFGLACPLDKSHSGPVLGTQLYAAPEQLDGKCDVKSDIFSLGIVLLELIESFSTDMERVHNITELRKGRLAAHISANYPQLAHIMSQLVSRRPALRPDSAKLITLLENDNTSIMNVNHLQQQIKDKDAEIERLKALLNKVGVQL